MIGFVGVSISSQAFMECNCSRLHKYGCFMDVQQVKHWLNTIVHSFPAVTKFTLKSQPASDITQPRFPWVIPDIKPALHISNELFPWSYSRPQLTSHIKECISSPLGYSRL